MHTARWVTALAQRGHSIHVITDEPTPSLPAEVFNPYDEMGSWARVPKVRVLVAERRILDRVRAIGPDIVHQHWLKPTWGTTRLARRLPPMVVSVWGKDLIWDEPNREPILRRLYQRRILARACHVTATSEFLARRLDGMLRHGTPLSIVPFGVDCDRFRPAAHGQDRATPVIGFLKHYLPKYGADVLLRAAALLAGRGVQFRMEMYGTTDPAPYRTLSERLRLTDRVTLHASVAHDEVPETLRRFDIFAMPSIYDSETFGVAAVEAAACGLPVVASRVGGVPEVVRHGVTGLLVEPADPEALADALEGLLHDAGLRTRMAAAGRAQAERLYDWKTCVDRMEEVYARVLTGPGAAA